MTVSETRDITIIPWRAGVEPADPAYPASMWFFHNVVTGDASAGLIEAAATLEASGKTTARLWTIEGIDGHRVDNVADQFAVLLTGFGRDAPDTPQLARVIATVQSGPNRAFSGLSQLYRPWGFPFQHNPGSGDLTLSMTFDTNTSGITYRFTAWGWIWETAALRTPTGPRKPW